MCEIGTESPTRVVITSEGSKIVGTIMSSIVISINLANAVGLRARSSLKQDLAGNEDEEDFRPWRRRLLSAMKMKVSFAFTWSSAVRASMFLMLLATFAYACFSLPIEKILKNFLLWIKEELGPWGPLVLAIAYIPLTVFAVPASVLTLGGGYLFGLPVGFVADSIGATLGATAAFLVGKTIGRSYVISKLKKYPKFQAIAIAIQRSGFKIVLLLRFVPLLPFNVLNYLLSVTPVRLWEYMLATWLGMMPITFMFVYIGTTLSDLSDITHGWHEISKTRWVMIMIVYIIKVAKASLEKALAENGEIGCIDLDSPGLPIVVDSALGLHRPLITTVDSTLDDLGGKGARTVEESGEAGSFDGNGRLWTMNLLKKALWYGVKGTDTKSRGLALEKKIEYLESLNDRVSNRRARRWINDRILLELVPRLTGDEIRGLFAPPPWGDEARPSPFCMTNVGEWDKFRNIDMDKEAGVIEALKGSLSKKKNRVDADKIAALTAWHRVDCKTRDAFRRSFLPELVDGYEENIRAFISEADGEEVLVLRVQDPFHRLLLHGVCEFYNLVSITESETKGTKVLKMTKIKKKKAGSIELPTITLCQFLKMAKDGFW
ncbi:hypothetical protein E3N88_46258 [Mikania micrantha]|uniref:Uncharacterized protein n=1 Tax=Mikania micrantha TaxID=192012 RepID=A0A5N6L6Y3_9ASTR|nr:hypothetical protein E3N88_46258 [Mikania micrantha]